MRETLQERVKTLQRYNIRQNQQTKTPTLHKIKTPTIQNINQCS